MARITGGTVQQQACLKQQIEKEEATALRFFVQNIEKLKVPSGASAVLRKKLEQTKVDAARCNRLAEEAAKRAEERRKAAAENLSAMLDMRPPSPATKALLYNGISHDRHGSVWWRVSYTMWKHC
ncbi:unnamed protein product [Dicrocoelium dendriticum]|nr:unnamed protein product [Dicrocoelium dendriticum]